jgi:hypothetical protein
MVTLPLPLWLPYPTFSHGYPTSAWLVILFPSLEDCSYPSCSHDHLTTTTWVTLPLPLYLPSLTHAYRAINTMITLPSHPLHQISLYFSYYSWLPYFCLAKHTV